MADYTGDWLAEEDENAVTNESNPGVHIFWNSDDDDENGIMDCAAAQMRPVQNEDDLVPVSICIEPGASTNGTVTLNLSPKVTLWNRTRTQRVRPGSYSLAAFEQWVPSYLYLEGLQLSAQPRDAYVHVSYAGAFDEAKITVFGCNLTMHKPVDGSPAVTEDKEESDGELLQVNVDDDDGDMGTGANKIADSHDNNVADEDDMMKLSLTSVGLPDQCQIKLSFSDSHIKLWMNSNKTGVVEPQQTTFPINQLSYVYVEGFMPSVENDGEMIAMQVHNGSQLLCEDIVKVAVANTIFGIFGLGGEGGYDELRQYLVDNGEKRPDCYMLKNAQGNAFSIWISKAKPAFQLALGTESASVVFHGHSNFGIGPSFNYSSSIQDFMNTGEDLCAINYGYLINEGHTSFRVAKGGANNEYGDDPSTPAFGDPFRYVADVQGAMYGNKAVYRYAPTLSGGSSSIRLQLFEPEPIPTFDYHLNAVPGEQRLVVKCGTSTSDMPILRYNKLLLKMCYSGKYFRNIFNNGTLFFSTDLTFVDSSPTEFVKHIVEGYDNTEIVDALHQTDPPEQGSDSRYDYYSF